MQNRKENDLTEASTYFGSRTYLRYHTLDNSEAPQCRSAIRKNHNEPPVTLIKK